MITSRRRSLALVVALAALGASCVQQDPPGLAVSELEAKLVFGLDEVPEPGLTPAEATQQIPVLDIPDLFVSDDDPIVRKPYLQPPDPAIDPCPPAKNAAAVEFGAVDNVNTDRQRGNPPGYAGNRPVEGVYRWRIMYSAGSGSDLPYDKLTPGGFELRAIRNVREVPPDQWSVSPSATSSREVFTYEEVRNISYREQETTANGVTERLIERFLITTYLVDTAAFRARASQTDLVLQAPSSGNPERGVTLKKSVTVDGKGQPVPGVDSFEPTTGLTLMGLPFVSGESFAASATDASHGRTVTNQTVVNPRKRFNACGDLMEGFPSVSTQTISSNDSAGSQVFELQYWIAPQHGGVVILEDTYGTTTGLRFVLHRASLNPMGPVPADGLPR